MKRTKILSVIMSAAVMFSLSVPAASAASEDPSNSGSITFGDSIAVSSEKQQSFASLTGEYIMTKYIYDFSSYNTENGRTSADILQAVKSDENLKDGRTICPTLKDEHYENLYVFISSGGNDYLDFFEEILNPYLEEGDSLMTLTPEKTEAIKSKISADSENFMNNFSKADELTDSIIENSKEMVSVIKQEQPEAEIYFLEIYNPFDRFSESGDETMSLISRTADGVLKKFNTKLAEIEGIHTVPVYSAIKEHPTDFIIENDIHPTLAGHVRISQLILNDITKEDDKTILGSMVTGINNFEPLLSKSQFDSLPEYMKEGVVTEPVVTTEAASAETTVTSASETTVSSAVTSNETTASATASQQVTSTSSAATSKSADGSPKTSDRGLSSVVVSGFFAAAAACVAFRKKSDK